MNLNNLPEKLIDEVETISKERKLTKEQNKKVLERVKKAYEAALIHPGESIGIVTAESFGEPSTQMCTSRDEKIIIKIKNRIRIIKIGDFVDKIFRKVQTRVVKKYEIYNVSENLKVLSLDKDEKLKWKKVIALNRIKAPKKLLQIVTKTGRKIMATDYHSFVTRSHNKVVPIAGKDLKIGDRIPVMRYLPEHCASSVLVSDYISEYNVENGLLIGNTFKTKSIPNNMPLDKLFGWFVGAFLAEGNVTSGQVSISNVNENYIFNLKDFISSIGLSWKECWKQGEYVERCDIKISSTLLAKFIQSICKTGSSKKIVPEFAYSAKEEFVSGLLKGYFDGDGNINVDRKMIRVSSNSEELLDGIKLLLTRFKIYAFKSRDYKQDCLIIPYKYANTYLKNIGSDIDYNLFSLKKISKMAEENIIKNYRDHNDMISGFDNILVDISRKLGLCTRYVNSATKRQKIGRTALLRHINRFDRVAKGEKIDIKVELKLLRQMYDSDVVWDAIEKVEYVKYPYEYVYDLSVPGLETFTTFDGIVTHNTLNVFHFAGVAEMAVTLGLPRLIELFDARKKPSTPRTEVYLDKEHNKSSDKVKAIAAQIKQTTLGNITDEFSLNISKLRVEVSVNKGKMKELNISEKGLVTAMSEGLKGVNVKQTKNYIIITLTKEDFEINELYQLKEKAKDVIVKGIKGIEQVLPVKRGNEFVILCSGANLKDVFVVKGVDQSRTVTNDLFLTADTLGIEAARNIIIREALEVIDNQGLDIDIRHIMFLADTMTTNGIVSGITRGGITSGKESVLARASFETPLTHIINASLKGEVDYLNSVVENVMLNQPVPVGTGLPGLVAKMKDKKK